jgi:Cu-processing system permease protein
MRTATRIMRYVLLDVLRNRWVLGYALFFLVATDALLRLDGTGARAIISLLNLVLLLVPMVTIVFGTMYWHGAREFNELLLTQPVDRTSLFHGLFAGLVLPLSAAFATGVSVPFVVHGAFDNPGALALLLLAGISLTAVFGAIAILVSGHSADRLRGLAIALTIWLAATVLYDGFVLWFTIAFRDIALEQPLLALTIANPVDLARVLLLLQLDTASLTGATAAVFQRVFTGTTGMAIALFALSLWALIPGILALRAFRRRDF